MISFENLVSSNHWAVLPRHIESNAIANTVFQKHTPAYPYTREKTCLYQNPLRFGPPRFSVPSYTHLHLDPPVRLVSHDLQLLNLPPVHLATPPIVALDVQRGKLPRLSE